MVSWSYTFVSIFPWVLSCSTTPRQVRYEWFPLKESWYKDSTIMAKTSRAQALTSNPEGEAAAAIWGEET